MVHSLRQSRAMAPGTRMKTYRYRRVSCAVVDSTLLSRIAPLKITSFLSLLFDEIRIPDEVYREVGKGPGKAGRRLRKYIGNHPGLLFRCPDRDKVVLRVLQADLDMGESAAIAQATFLQQHYRTVVVITDDAAAYKKALSMDFGVYRTGRLLVELKKVGAISEVRPYLEQLYRMGFRLSGNALHAVLHAAGEICTAPDEKCVA